MLRIIVVVMVVGFMVLVSGHKPSSATESPADFYKRNVVTLYAGHSAGGGTDFIGRALASFWAEATGGTMRVENKEGGGGIVMANYVYAAKPDGLTLGVGEFGGSLIAPTLFLDPAVKFNITKLNYIGFLGYSPYGIAVGINRPYQSLADLQKSVGFKFGGTGVQDNMALAAALVINALGLKDARIVTGYGGSAEVAAAAAKGEIDGMANPAATIYRDIEKKFVKPPFLIVERQRTEWFPNVPALTEVVKLSAEQETTMNVFLGLKGGKVFFATPSIPEERIEFIRSAFDRIVKMKNFLALMEKAVAIWTAPTNGRDLFTEVGKLTKVSKEDVAKLRNLVEVYRR